MNDGKKPFLPTERQKTDESLVAEREKTNESLMKSQSQTEKQVDQAVVDERTIADQKTSDTRDKADASRDKNRTSSEYNVQDEIKNSDLRLKEERTRADVAISRERAKVDQAIEKERDLKGVLANKLLERERKITDQNLKHERFQTDSQVESASGLLASEVDSHSKTKLALTTREEFLAIVSHDLRNPVGAASSCASLLLEDLAAGDVSLDDLKYWLVFIKRNSDTALRLIDDLLDVERVSQGKIIIAPVMCDLAGLIQESVETFSLVAQAKDIHLGTTLSDSMAECFCDPDRVRQVISNLIANAIKFTPSGGTVNVELKAFENDIAVSVTDTGVGIAKEKQAEIFVRFAQIGSTERTGLGLGLYISKTLIESHGGKLSVESEVGKGSKFTFNIFKFDKRTKGLGVLPN